MGWIKGLFPRMWTDTPGCTYRDQIWKINEDDSEELIWENEQRSTKWKSDNDPDSEYNKMMDLHLQYDFNRWDDDDYNLPSFEHRIVERDKKGNEKVVEYDWLLEEFMST